MGNKESYFLFQESELSESLASLPLAANSHNWRALPPNFQEMRPELWSDLLRVTGMWAAEGHLLLWGLPFLCGHGTTSPQLSQGPLAGSQSQAWWGKALCSSWNKIRFHKPSLLLSWAVLWGRAGAGGWRWAEVRRLTPLRISKLREQRSTQIDGCQSFWVCLCQSQMDTRD